MIILNTWLVLRLGIFHILALLHTLHNSFFSLNLSFSLLSFSNNYCSFCISHFILSYLSPLFLISSLSLSHLFHPNSLAIHVFFLSLSPFNSSSFPFSLSLSLSPFSLSLSFSLCLSVSLSLCFSLSLSDRVIEI